MKKLTGFETKTVTKDCKCVGGSRKARTIFKSDDLSCGFCGRIFKVQVLSPQIRPTTGGVFSMDNQNGNKKLTKGEAELIQAALTNRIIAVEGRRGGGRRSFYVLQGVLKKFEAQMGITPL